MTSQYRHRRSSISSATFPTLEPGEISVNTANRQIAVGDAATGTVGQPKNLIALRYFDVTAQYVANDYVANASGVIYRANKPTGPGAFVPADWNMMLGQIDPQYVAKAGDVMTGMLTLPATVPTIGTHATNKTYVDTQDAALKTWVDSQDAALTGSKVDRAGDTMTGMLTLPVTTPTAGQHATHKTYVDGMIAAKSSVLTSDTPPVGAPDNTLWVETDTGKMFVRINDGNSTQWVQVIAGSAQSQLKKNYIINGGMMISQENGATSGFFSGSIYYPVDEFFTLANNTGTFSSQQVASLTPGGSPNRIRITGSTADASVAAGDYMILMLKIEGLRTADLKAGTASAKTVTLQFGVKGPAGTYCVAFRNGVTSNRSYVAEYVIAAGEANTDVVKSITVPLDVTGTWVTDNTAGLSVTWGFMGGATFQTPAGVWTAGSFFCTANQFNLAGSISNVFELFDVSLTEGSVAPPFQVPDYASELAACQRYWAIGQVQWYGYVVSGQTNVSANVNFTVNMRGMPTITLVNNGGSGTVAGVGASVASYYGDGVLITYNTLAAGNASTNTTWKANARL